MRLYKFGLYDKDENEVDTISLLTGGADKAMEIFKDEYENVIPDFTDYYVDYIDWEWRSNEEEYHGY